jgi:hypothetical protein
MFFLVLFVAAAFLAGAFFLRRLLPQYATAIQRSWLVRVSLFAFCGLLLLGLVLVPLPNKHRLVALVPIFFLVTAFIRVFKSGKARVRSGEASSPDLERMKRMNP